MAIRSRRLRISAGWSARRHSFAFFHLRHCRSISALPIKKPEFVVEKRNGQRSALVASAAPVAEAMERVHRWPGLPHLAEPIRRSGADKSGCGRVQLRQLDSPGTKDVDSMNEAAIEHRAARV